MPKIHRADTESINLKQGNHFFTQLRKNVSKYCDTENHRMFAVVTDLNF